MRRLCQRIDSCQKKKQGDEIEEKLHEAKIKLTEAMVDMLAKKIEVKEDVKFGKLTLFLPFFNCQPCRIFTLPMIHLFSPQKFCITIVSNCYWVLQSSQWKLKTMHNYTNRF